MDPLSVTAAVVGLLAAAGQVASVLSKIKSSVSDAPSSIEQTFLYVKELQACFAAVHKFIVGATPGTSASQRRLSMIEVDQLVATLTESVLTFSELELLVTPFGTCPQASMRNRIKWAWKEDVVSRIMLRLDRHKSCLSLMLNIVQCESDREAKQSQQSLLILVRQLVESNVEISRRLKSLETTFETESILTACFRNGNSGETGESEEATTDQPLEISQRTTSMILDNSSTGMPSIVFHSAFENDLNDSRVYKRTQPYECDVSFTSSAVRSHTWSVFSGLSLSQISSISVIALPVYSHEISNKEWYGFVFFDQPDSQGMPTLAAMDEEIQEVEEVEQEINYYIEIYDNDSDSKSDEAMARPTEAANHSGRTRADIWIPQATTDGRLFYLNTETGESSMELPLELHCSPTASSDPDQTVKTTTEPDFWIPQATLNGTLFYFNTMTGESSLEHPLESSSSRMQNEAGDPLNVEILVESRPPPEMMARNNTEDENHESDGSSVSELEGERIILASIDPQPSNTGDSTDPIFQSIETNFSKIQPYVPSPVISGPPRKMVLYKLVVFGDSDVGKTELTFQLTLQHFVKTYDPTIQDSYRKQVVIDGQSCMLEVLDTAAQEEYTALRDPWIRDGEGFVLVYSITKRRSFELISRFHNQIQRVKEASASSPSYPGSPFAPQHYNPAKMPPIMLVGNNSDLVTEREVSTKEGYDLARELGCNFVEASVKNCINVEKAFYDVVRQLRRERMEARPRMLAASREVTQGHYAPRQDRRPQKKAGGVSQVWQRVRARAS